MIPEWPVETAGEAETEAVGRFLAPRLGAGGILALYGELGTGKTRLVRGLVAALGGDPYLVTSPTFTLVQEYACPALTLYHVDAYRAESLDELLALGIEDVLYGDGAAVVEWPERLEPLFPSDTLRVRLTHLGGDRRRIERLGHD